MADKRKPKIKPTNDFIDKDQAARKVLEYYLRYLKSETTVTTVSIEGISADVLPGVFQTGTDGRLLGAHLQAYIDAGYTRVLDITAGCGILAVMASVYGAHGVAADINPAAVRNMRHNFAAADADFTAVESDVFANIKPQKFDLIIATPPYLDSEITEPLDYSVFGASAFANAFLKDAHRYLAKNGRALVTFAKWGALKDLKSKIKANGWQFRIVDTRQSSDGEREHVLYELWR